MPFSPPRPEHIETINVLELHNAQRRKGLLGCGVARRRAIDMGLVSDSRSSGELERPRAPLEELER
ncbi:MAG: hypothetical protein CSA65_04030 [Proteobacteria bacterium]|nr:MAG: hypothetical protein CSA65_04030 [Pseudomonadota bacterium]